MRTRRLGRTGLEVTELGYGAWGIGGTGWLGASDDESLRALLRAVELGVNFIDTAYVYGDGHSEELVGEALRAAAETVYVATKVPPKNLEWPARAGVPVSETFPAEWIVRCTERSLRNLGLETIDVQQLHVWSDEWLGEGDWLDAIERLKRDGKIARWGVSNFDVGDMEDLFAVRGGDECACNQVLYNLSERGAEWRLIDWCRGRRVPLMAYSPIGQGTLLRNRKLAAIAQSLGHTPAQVALAWTMRHPDVIAIPQTSDLGHLAEDRAAANVVLDAAALAALDVAFPPPRQPTTLSVI